MAKRMSGLTKRGEVWHIDKRIRGYGTVRESTGTGDREEAERILVMRMEEIRKQEIFGERPKITFREAVHKYFTEGYCPPKSMERAANALDHVLPFVGDMFLEQVHNDSLAAFKKHRKKEGAAANTINKELTYTRRILILASRMWRHDNGTTYLSAPPLIEMVKGPQKKPYPLSWDDQAAFLRELPPHLERMALFDLNCGLRERALCALEWDMEVQVPELGTSVFMCPGWMNDKNDDEEYLLVLNDVAHSVLDSVRGQHPKYVFVYKDAPVERMHNSAWKKAWRRAGLPVTKDLKRGPHNLRHTYGHRLRAAGVPEEDRMDLLWHTSGKMSRRYATPDVARLLEASNKVIETKRTTMLRTVYTRSS